MTPAKWEIWLADVPYEDVEGSKVRPVLVIDSQEPVIIVGKMTSKPPRPGYPYEYQITDWKNAGLKVQTTLRLSKILRLDMDRFRRKMGDLQPADHIKVREMLSRISLGDLQQIAGMLRIVNQYSVLVLAGYRIFFRLQPLAQTVWA